MSSNVTHKCGSNRLLYSDSYFVNVT
uniref:Uncharacterized protein n=1 Tax=Anguilla anguilla TaxID=7936 RepID=A0A0E9TS60_ANGAN